jgi:Flp pilus assembly protein CpaB
MAPTRKPKKAFIQFVIAAFVAVLVGALAITLTYRVVQGIIEFNNKEKQEALAQAEDTKSELERVKQEQERNKSKTKNLVVQASTSIPKWATISRTMVSQVEVDDASFIPPDSFRDLGQVIGKKSLVAIASGETLTQEKLGDLQKGFLSIPSGFRAITIKIDPIAGLNGAIVAGAFVDIISTFDGEQQAFSKTLLQRVNVVSINEGGGSNERTGASKPVESVTVAVTPSQAEVLALANQKGKFHLTLRNDDDLETKTLAGINVSQLQGKKLGASSGPVGAKQINSGFSQPSGVLNNYFKAQPPTIAPSKAFTMEIYKGANSESKTFENAN